MSFYFAFHLSFQIFMYIVFCIIFISQRSLCIFKFCINFVLPVVYVFLCFASFLWWFSYKGTGQVDALNAFEFLYCTFQGDSSVTNRLCSCICGFKCGVSFVIVCFLSSPPQSDFTYLSVTMRTNGCLLHRNYSHFIMFNFSFCGLDIIASLIMFWYLTFCHLINSG